MPTKAQGPTKKAPARRAPVNNRTAPPDPTPEAETQPEQPPQTIGPINGPAYENVHVLQARILAELPAIGKDSYNKQQDFYFRGIDAVLNALHPLLGKYGVRIIPHRILDVERSQRMSAASKPVYVTTCRVQFRWYGPNGDYVEAEGIGEGTDSGDKSTPKAVQGAYKYMLFEALSIATAEGTALDTDAGTPPETIAPELAAIIERHQALPEDLATRVGEALTKANNGNPVNPAVLPSGSWWEFYERTVALGEKRLAERLAEAQDADAMAPQVPATPAVAHETPPERPPVDETPVVAPSPPEPETAPASTPEPPTDPEPELGDDVPADGDDEEEITWAMVERMTKDELNTRLEEEGAMPGGRSIGVDKLRRIYWQVIGGQLEGDVPADERPKFPCPVPGCKQFEWESRDDVENHIKEAHPTAVQSEDGTWSESLPEPDPTPSAADDGGASKPADEHIVAHVKNLMSKLKGGAKTRAFAKYRREMGLPERPEDMTFDQAFGLAEFLEKLPD